MTTPQLPTVSPEIINPEDKMFYAVQTVNVKDGRTVLPDAIRLPEFSCNWERYRSFPEAVLANFADRPEDTYLFVPSFRAGQMSTSSTADGRVFWDVGVVHVPEEQNYSHSEVQVFRRGETHHPKTRPSSSKVKMELKAHFAGQMRIIPKYGPK